MSLMAVLFDRRDMVGTRLRITEAASFSGRNRNGARARQPCVVRLRRGYTTHNAGAASSRPARRGDDFAGSLNYRAARPIASWRAGGRLCGRSRDEDGGASSGAGPCRRRRDRRSQDISSFMGPPAGARLVQKSRTAMDVRWPSARRAVACRCQFGIITARRRAFVRGGRRCRYDARPAVRQDGVANRHGESARAYEETRRRTA